LLASNIDPTDEEKNPREAEKSDKGGIYGDESTKCYKMLVSVMDFESTCVFLHIDGIL
jgi:hypothetical protein